jgi:hypothetical protein
MIKKRKRERVERDVCATSWLNCIISYCITMLSIYSETKSKEQINLK